MPSPLGHALGGLIVHWGTTRRDARALDRAAVFVVAAVAPDLDLLLKPLGWAQHQGASHSVGAALLAGLAVFAAARVWRPGRAISLSIAATLGWLSHVLLDYLGRDTHPPIGLLALWPISAEYWKCPWPLFRDIGRSFEWEAIVHNTVSVTWELVVLVPPLYLLAKRHRFL